MVEQIKVKKTIQDKVKTPHFSFTNTFIHPALGATDFPYERDAGYYFIFTDGTRRAVSRNEFEKFEVNQEYEFTFVVSSSTGEKEKSDKTVVLVLILFVATIIIPQVFCWLIKVYMHSIY